jgi:SNF family Na+-dependent transporter
VSAGVEKGLDVAVSGMLPQLAVFLVIAFYSYIFS